MDRLKLMGVVQEVQYPEAIYREVEQPYSLYVPPTRVPVQVSTLSCYLLE